MINPPFFGIMRKNTPEYGREEQNMLNNATPESAGIRSEDLLTLLSLIEKRGLHMHSLLVMRGD